MGSPSVSDRLCHHDQLEYHLAHVHHVARHWKADIQSPATHRRTPENPLMPCQAACLNPVPILIFPGRNLSTSVSRFRSGRWVIYRWKLCQVKRRHESRFRLYGFPDFGLVKWLCFTKKKRPKHKKTLVQWWFQGAWRSVWSCMKLLTNGGIFNPGDFKSQVHVLQTWASELRPRDPNSPEPLAQLAYDRHPPNTWHRRGLTMTGSIFTSSRLPSLAPTETLSQPL